MLLDSETDWLGRLCCMENNVWRVWTRSFCWFRGRIWKRSCKYVIEVIVKKYSTVQNKHSTLLCTFILYFDIIAAENKCEQNMPILIRRKCGSLWISIRIRLLIIVNNKNLAVQLYGEFKESFPEIAVE